MIKFNEPLKNQLPELKLFILSLVDKPSIELVHWLDSRDVKMFDHQLKIKPKAEWFDINGSEKMRVNWLLWGYFFPEIFETLDRMRASVWRKLGSWEEMNLWYVRPPKEFELPLMINFQLQHSQIEIQSELDERYRSWKKSRIQQQFEQVLEVGSDDEFEFLD